jgi:hypothetical protein
VTLGHRPQAQPAPRKLQPVATAWRRANRLGRVETSKQVLSDLHMNSLLALRTLLLLALVVAAAAVLVQPGLGGAGDQAAHAMLMVARN